jgi:hypothetical protein
MVTLTTGIISFLFTCMHFWVWKFYDSGPRVSRLPIKWSAIDKILRNNDLQKLLDHYKDRIECHGRIVNTPSYSGGPGFKSRPGTGYPV